MKQSWINQLNRKYNRLCELGEIDQANKIILKTLDELTIAINLKVED